MTETEWRCESERDDGIKFILRNKVRYTGVRRFKKIMKEEDTHKKILFLW
jgi:hypothetical protein